jgi:two-component system copper resistance phosphate regulon response regulator CusR
MRKILLVEDDEVLRETYAIILSTEPYQLDTAEDGEVALEKCSHTTYDLILLDLMMPGVDGAGFLERFMPAPTGTKVIVMSNLSSGDLHDKAMKLGADRSVVKADLTPKQLLAMIRYEVDAS